MTPTTPCPRCDGAILWGKCCQDGCQRPAIPTPEEVVDEIISANRKAINNDLVGNVWSDIFHAIREAEQRGWNAAIEAAAKVADKEYDVRTSSDGKIAASKIGKGIRALEKH